MKIVTICTHSERYFSCLLQSLKRFHTPLIILEWGQQWTGNAQKLRAIRKFLKTQPDDEIICLIDAFDCIFLRPPCELEQAFRKMKHNMVIATDGESPNIIVQYFINAVFPRVHGQTVNSGTYIAYAKHLRKVLSHVERFVKDSNNDQVMLCDAAKQNSSCFHIDNQSELFLTLYTGRKLSLSNTSPNELLLSKIDFIINPKTQFPELYWKPTQTFPSILHCPGDGNINIIIERLGYKLPLSIKCYTQWDHLKYLYRNTKHYRKICPSDMIFVTILVLLLLTMCILIVIYGVSHFTSIFKKYS